MRGIPPGATRSGNSRPLIAVYVENPWLRQVVVAVLERHGLSVESIIDAEHVSRLASGPASGALRAAIVAHAWDASGGQRIVASLRSARADIGIVSIDGPDRSAPRELHLATPFGPVALLDAIGALLEVGTDDAASASKTPEADPKS